MADYRYRVFLAIFALCVLNFFAFVIFSMWIGGDALSGKVVEGHFFIGEHGKLTEVSEAVFTYSLWHSRSLFITHPLAVVIWYFANAERKKRGRMRSEAATVAGR